MEFEIETTGFPAKQRYIAYVPILTAFTDGYRFNIYTLGVYSNRDNAIKAVDDKCKAIREDWLWDNSRGSKMPPRNAAEAIKSGLCSINKVYIDGVMKEI